MFIMVRIFALFWASFARELGYTTPRTVTIGILGSIG